MIRLTAEIRENITNKVKSILVKEFGSGEKSHVKEGYDRLNFACPYCGDSDSNKRKKRGNIYWKNLNFHCFNSGCSKKHGTVIDFLKEHNEKFTNIDNLKTVLDYISENTVVKKRADYLEFGSMKKLNELAIDRDVLKKELNLIEVKGCKRWNWLKYRMVHKRQEYFLYDDKRDKLFILNLTPDKQKVIGYQIRNFGKYDRKYISSNIQAMHLEILKNKILIPEAEMQKINTLSIWFGIMEINWTTDITIFEGPMDHLLYPGNSLALSGVEKDTTSFDDIERVRYFLDNDRAGRKVMEKKLKERKQVFKWIAFMRDHKIQPIKAEMKEVKDFGDLINYFKFTKQKGFENINKYFTNNPLDIRDV